MADWVNDVIDAVGHKEASLVGHSQGCLVTVECTARYPDKIKTFKFNGWSWSNSNESSITIFSRK